jgi:hypothetical protein
VIATFFSPFGLAFGFGLHSALLVMIAGAALVAGGAGLFWQGRHKGEVLVDDKGVSVQGQVILKRESIANAHFFPAAAGRPSSVRFLDKAGGEPGWVAVKDEAQAREVLGALGFGTNKSVAHFHAIGKGGRAQGLALFASIALILLFAMAAASFHAPLLATLAGLPLLVTQIVFSKGDIYLGTDGLLYRQRFESRFFSWSEVADVSAWKRGITVDFHSGETFNIPIATPKGMRRQATRISQASLIAQAKERLEAFRDGSVPDITARVGRLGQTTAQWVDRLLDREGSFRQAPLRSEDLWSVLESPAAGATARAGAAAVLAKEASPDDRARFRIAADVCAEPKLRVVLEKAADGADVIEALDSVEEEESRAHAR